jgi:hypothetical protein
MVKSARGRAARTSTPDHHPWALRGQSPPPPRGGTRAAKKTHVPGGILAEKRATDLSKTVSETGEADKRF